MRRSFALQTYATLTSAGRLFVPLFLRVRIQRGKEDPRRVAERRGTATHKRPDGRLVWLHGASIGECLSLLPCMEEVVGQGFHVVVTSGSTGSARVLAERLPARTVHQFLPLDIYRYASRFLEHWRPEIVLVAESEIWPNTFRAVKKRGIPLVSVNARLSEKSFSRWSTASKAARQVFGMIDLCLAQSQEDAERFADLGARDVRVIGNLKFDAKAPPVSRAELSDLSSRLGARAVWAAVSTHAGEEDIAADVHLALRTRLPSLLTIIAPRHPHRGDDVAEMLLRKNLRVARRSKGELLTQQTDIYLADTLGETGLLYRLGALAFVGRSLTAKGGQNPIEAAKLGCAILHGPHVGAFREVYAALDQREGALVVTDRATLTEAIARLLTDAQALRHMARSAAAVAEEQSGATARVLQAIEPYLALGT